MPKRTHDGIKKRCDCQRKNWPKCSHPWHFSFHFAGREHRLSLDAVARIRGVPPPTTKADAATWRDTLRNEIRAGKDPMADPKPIATASNGSMTIGQLIDRYEIEFLGKTELKPGEIEWKPTEIRATTAQSAHYHLRLARNCSMPAGVLPAQLFEDRPIGQVTRGDIEAIRLARRPHGRVGCNRLLTRVRHLFNWAIRQEICDSTPFKRNGLPMIKIDTSAEEQRSRRLGPGDEARLLAGASPLLRSLIVAALSTGCRVGELLSLQWAQIQHDEKGVARTLVLPASKTKTKTDRAIPIGQRLAAELAMRRHGPDGKELPLDAYVFGDEAGGQVKSVKRAWESCVLRAHGFQPTWVKGKPGQLAPELRAELRRINLHFHDLRRQFACTLLELTSARLHDVSEFLGHAKITTTSRYLKSTPVRLAGVLAEMESKKDDSIRTPFAQTATKADHVTEGDAAKLLN